MNWILRGVRVIDALGGINASGRDVWLRDGLVAAISNRVDSDTAAVVDLTPPPGGEPMILCPAFIDLHAHLREPGDTVAETVRSGALAAAAGGFADLVAMANTRPPIDTPERVARSCERAAQARVRVHTAAAVTRGLRGKRLVDIAGCVAAGAVAFTDDGRNAASPEVLCEALEAAAPAGRPVLVHPEDEGLIAFAARGGGEVTRCPDRPPVAEVSAVSAALGALRRARDGRLHLQHLSTAGSVELLRRARDAGLAATAEVTPHHLALHAPLAEPPVPAALAKVNPPLREERDRMTVVDALREGVIDAVATDHAPHPASAKEMDYADAAPGMIGLETALATCISLGGMGGAWIGVLVERLTAGPWRVLGAGSAVPPPILQVGGPATCVLFDPAAEWTVGEEPAHSRSRNTPLRGTRLRGRVLLTVLEGSVVHHDPRRLPQLVSTGRDGAARQGTLPMSVASGAAT